MTEIRDRRHAAWFWIDKAILDDYGQQIGAYGIAVYALLARHADNKGKAFPSLAKMAEALRLSKQSIIRALETLITVGLIEKSSRKSEHGDATTNVYTLLQIGGGSPQELPSSPQELPSTPQGLQVVPHRDYRSSLRELPTSFLTRTIEQEPFEQEENILHLGSEVTAGVENSTPAAPSVAVAEMASPTKLKKPPKVKPAPTPWPAEDRAFADWLTTQQILTCIAPPVDCDWWCDMSYVINGIPATEWLEREYAKMQMYLREKPQKKPTPRGTSRFVRTWLEKAYNDDRRQRLPSSQTKEVHIHYNNDRRR